MIVGRLQVKKQPGMIAAIAGQRAMNLHLVVFAAAQFQNEFFHFLEYQDITFHHIPQQDIVCHKVAEMNTGASPAGISPIS